MEDIKEKMRNIKKKINFKIIICIAGIILGIATIIVATNEFSYTWGRTVGYKTYGGEAYTGMQNAAAQTATNVYWTFDAIRIFSKSFLIILGVLIILHYSLLLYETIKNASKK